MFRIWELDKNGWMCENRIANGVICTPQSNFLSDYERKKVAFSIANVAKIDFQIYSDDMKTDFLPSSIYESVSTSYPDLYYKVSAQMI